MKGQELFEKYKEEAEEKDINVIEKKIGKMNKGKITELWNDVLLLYKMIKDPNAPWQSKAVAIGSLIYLVSTIDAIPDIIPFFGLVDDAGIIVYAIKVLSKQLKEYKGDISDVAEEVVLIRNRTLNLKDKIVSIIRRIFNNG